MASRASRATTNSDKVVTLAEADRATPNDGGRVRLAGVGVVYRGVPVAGVGIHDGTLEGQAVA